MVFVLVLAEAFGVVYVSHFANILQKNSWIGAIFMNYKRPRCLSNNPDTYCPGCAHGIATKLVAEVIDELGIEGDVIAVGSVGCSVFLPDFYNFDTVGAAHGRAPAVATAVKRLRPGNIVFTYQGDGDLASIGTAEIIHAANRGENITVIFINNGIYGMTGGQCAPTTLVGQVTKTSPYGRSVQNEGYPIDMCKLLATLEAPVYIERCALCGVSEIRNTKRAIKKAFQCQADGLGFSIVELLSTCPTNWGLSPIDAMKYVKEKTESVYPLGVFRDKTAESAKVSRELA
jgi:2-oxoglutarate ferredoxin oxidoreductase subunit beta